jgi:hypothetical protein
MATSNLKSISVGLILIQSGNGSPDHQAPLGSRYINTDTGIESYNSDGGNTWSVITGLAWQDEVVIINLIGNTGTSITTATTNNCYIIDTGGDTGAWSGFSAGDIIQQQEAGWVFLKSLAIGDRFGITFENEVDPPIGDFVGEGDYIVEITGGTAGSWTYSHSAPVNNWAVFVDNQNATFRNISYTYSEDLLSWVKLAGGNDVTYGDGLDLTSNVVTSTYPNGFTYSDNTLTIQQTLSQPDLSVLIDSFTGLTVNGIFSATTIQGDGSAITGIDFSQLATTAHTHSISDITNLQTSLDDKFDKTGGVITGNVIVTGDVTIQGTATTINTETLLVEDNIITVNSNATGATAPILIDSGIDVLRNSGTTAALVWEESNEYWSAGLTGSTSKIILASDGLGDLATTAHTHTTSEITSFSGLPEEIGLAGSDEILDLATGSTVTYRMPYAMTLTEVRSNVKEAPSGSTIVTDIHLNGSTIFTGGTKLTIDSGEKTSTTAATPPVIDITALGDDDEIEFITDQVGSTTAGKGIKYWLIGTRT